MDKAIEWIKKGVGYCINIYDIDLNVVENYFQELQAEYNNFNNEEQSKVINILENEFLPEDLLFICSVFIYYMEIPIFHELVCDACLKCDFDYSMNALMDCQIAINAPTYYKKRKLLQEKHVDKLKNLLKMEYEYQPFEKRNKKRIVILTEQILQMRHAPTKIVINLAYALQKLMGYEVIVFACPCDYSGTEEVHSLWYSHYNMRSHDKNGIFDLDITYHSSKLRCYEISMKEDCISEYKKMLDIIYDWNPMFVFNLGAINPILELPHFFTTVVAKGMVGGLPISQADILLETGENVDRTKYLIDEYQKCLNINFDYTFFDESSETYDRERYGLPEDKFLISIVGNRLDLEINEDFISVMKSIIYENKNVGFVIFGVVDECKELIKKSGLEDFVFFMGYAEDLIGMYKMTNLYLNPIRIGGGFSSKMAVVAGLPVVTLPDCDVALSVGNDFVVQDCDEMIETVSHYVNDCVFYDMKKSCTKKFIEENSEEKMFENIKNVLQELIKAVYELEA